MARGETPATGLGARLSTWQRFFRARLLPTALANGATGAIAAGALTTAPTVSNALLAAGVIAGAYLFGMGANDWCDRRRDATGAPERPIPSGDLSPTAALIAILVALGFSLGCAALLPARTWPWVGAIFTAILLYDGLLKDQSWLGPLAMGSVRFFVTLFGASLIGEPIDGLLAALILGGHGFWVTRYSLEEERARPEVLAGRARAVFAHTGAAALLAVLFIKSPFLLHLGWSCPLVAWIVYGSRRSGFPPGWFTFRSLRVLLLLDGALQLSYNSPISAGICGLLFLWTGSPGIPFTRSRKQPKQPPAPAQSAAEPPPEGSKSS